MSDEETTVVNGTMSSSGDAPSETDRLKNIVNVSEERPAEENTTENAGGDFVTSGNVKTGNPPLTRIPTITLNDDSENADTVIIDCEDVPASDDSDRNASSSSPQELSDSAVTQEQCSDKKSEGESNAVSSVEGGTCDKDDVNGTTQTVASENPPGATESNNTTEASTTQNQSEAQDSEEDADKPDEPLDILGNGLLLKKVVTPGGDDKTRPVYSERVTLKTEGRLEDGAVVDKHEAITFTLGDGDVVQAWDLCTSLMGMGEVCELTTDAKYAYGAQGRSPDVPPNSKIIYTLELLKKEEALDLDKLSVEDRLKYGDEKRERGNYLFGRSNYSGAINSYSKALKILDARHSHSGDTSLLQQLVDVRIKCYNNIAAAQLKVEAFDAAIRSCDEVLKVQPENVKALFRKGKSHAAKGQTELAITVLKKTLKLDPESKIVQQELFKQTKKLKKETESEKEMYKKMFGSVKPPQPDKKKSTSFWKWGILATGALAAILLSVGIAVYRN